MIKSGFLLGGLALLTSALAFANPGAAVCLFAEATEETQLIRDAKKRIELVFAKPLANPIVINISNSQTIWPLSLNAYGSTIFLPSKTCVVLGPQGQNIDVAAHEMMHAEVVHRTGYWYRMTRVPTWFDEGLAMQVDQRSRYDLPTGKTSLDVQQLVTASDFFVSDSQQLTVHYAAAKQVVGSWVKKQNPQSVIKKLETIGTAASFHDWWQSRPNDER